MDRCQREGSGEVLRHLMLKGTTTTTVLVPRPNTTVDDWHVIPLASTLDHYFLLFKAHPLHQLRSMLKGTFYTYLHILQTSGCDQTTTDSRWQSSLKTKLNQWWNLSKTSRPYFSCLKRLLSIVLDGKSLENDKMCLYSARQCKQANIGWMALVVRCVTVYWDNICHL